MTRSLNLLSILVLFFAPLLSHASDCAQPACPQTCCSQCGCHQLKKVCRLVPDVKKIVKTEYGVECEDFCIPGKSKLCGEQCVTDCNGCCHREKVWQPTCCRVKTRAKLVKKTTTTEKPGFKCVVVTVCCGCGSPCGGCVEDQNGAPATAANDADASELLPVSAEIEDAAPEAPADAVRPAPRPSFVSRLLGTR